MNEYELLYQLCERVLREYDPCKKNDNNCLAGKPIPCCLKCQSLGNNGCTKLNLNCMTWLCRTVLEKIDSKCLEILKAIETIGKYLGYVRPPYIGQNYVGKPEF